MNHLRRLSKDQLHQLLDRLSASPELDGEIRRLLHELEVYQVELELQNRELRDAQTSLEASRDRYANLYHNAPVGYLTLDPRGFIRELNHAAAHLLGRERAKVVGQTLFHWLAAANHVPLLAHLRAVFRQRHQPHTLEFSLLSTPGDGSARYVRLQSLAMEPAGENGESLCHAALVDLTERRRAEDTIRALNADLERRVEERTAELRLAASVFHNSIQGVLISDREHRILSVNPAFTEITGYAAEEVVGRTPALLQCDRHDPGFYQAISDALDREGRWVGEVWHRRKDGEAFLTWLTVSLVSDPRGQPAGYVALISDITELRRKDEYIRHLAFHDALTDLPNRALLLDRLGHAMTVAKRERGHLALLFIDLDHFKEVNDRLGHNVGDALLQEVARRLRATVRASDTVARLGGDEFVVLMETVSGAQDCAVLAGKILGGLCGDFRVDGHVLRMGGSLGIALYPEDGEDPVTLMGHADMALYAAKGAGRGVHRFFRASMSHRPTPRPELVTELREALARGELELYYQPRVSLEGGQVCGLEALVRWRHPELGLLLPKEFIPLAERTGLILPIADWVLEETCRQAARWRARSLAPFRISLNLSARQLLEGDLVGQIQTLVGLHGLGPEALELELSEPAALAHAKRILDPFRQLRALGVGLAIDHFGTGQAGLGYLRGLPLDAIKMDRSLVIHAHQCQQEARLLRLSVALGEALRLAVVAEGVETQAQAEVLRHCCCPMAQGYLYSPPLPVGELERLWLERGGQADPAPTV